MYFIQKKNTKDIFQAAGRMLSVARWEGGDFQAVPSRLKSLLSSTQASGSSGRFSAALEAASPAGCSRPSPFTEHSPHHPAVGKVSKSAPSSWSQHLAVLSQSSVRSPPC